MKRIISIVLSLIMVIGMVPMTVISASAATVESSSTATVSGSGTTTDPYVVTTGQELRDVLAKKVSMNIVLGNNITVTSPINISKNTVIIMNNKTITANMSGSVSGIYVSKNATLTMYGGGVFKYSGKYHAVNVTGVFESSGSILYETNSGYPLFYSSDAVVRIHDGVFKGGAVDILGTSKLYMYDSVIYEGLLVDKFASSYIYDVTVEGDFTTYGVTRIFGGNFIGEVNSYPHSYGAGAILFLGGYFKKGIHCKDSANGDYLLADNAHCINHKSGQISDSELYTCTEMTVFSPAFESQIPQMDVGKTELDIGTIEQLQDYTVGFTAKDVPEIFVKNGYTIEEKLVVRDSVNFVDYQETKKGTTATGIYYNLNKLSADDYTIERTVNLYCNGSIVETKSDTVKVKVNPISESEFGFKTMTPAVSAEDKVSKYTDLGEKEYGTTLIFGYTPQLSQALVNKGYSTKEVVYVNYNNQGTLVTRKTGSNFDLMQYVDRMGDYQVWFSLQLYKDGEYVTSVGHIYNVTIVPIAVNTLKANVTAPVDGALPNATVSPAGEGYKTTDVDWSYYDETADDYYLMPDGMKFEAGKTYECAVQFEVVSDEYVFADDKAYMAGYINGYKGVISPVYSNKKAYVTVKFTVPDDQLKVIFTPDSKPQAGSKLTVDIEAMAERDDALMEAYLDNAVTYKWFYDGRLQYTTKNNSYELKNSNIGHYVAVKVLYGDEVIVSEEFLIEEAKITGLLGDVNEDGIVNIIDATTVQKYLASLLTLTDTQKKLADVDSNGTVNIIDATTIQKHLAGIETGYAIGEAI